MALSGQFPDIPQAYGARRDVTDGFVARGGALERMFEVDGQLRDIWVQGARKGLFTKLTITVGFYEDTTATKSLIGSSIVFSCESLLIVRIEDLPRRPLTNEILHMPRNTTWQIVECSEIRGFYQIGLNRASTS